MSRGELETVSLQSTYKSSGHRKLKLCVMPPMKQQEEMKSVSVYFLLSVFAATIMSDQEAGKSLSFGKKFLR